MNAAIVRKADAGWVSQVNAGLKMRAEGEAMVAAALRQRLDVVGETAWLQQCQDEWGWGRSAAYNHLNPLGLQRDRVAAAAARECPDRLDVTEEPATEPAPEMCEMPPAENQLAGVLMTLSAILAEGGYTIRGLQTAKVGRGKWKFLPEIKKLIKVLTKLQEELES